MKLEEQELKELKDNFETFNQLKLKIADSELNKAGLIEKVNYLKTEHSVLEDKLSKKYGESNINIHTGEVTPKTE